MVHKILFLIFLSAISVSAFSQSVKVRKIKKLPLNKEASFPSFTNSKHEVLLTGENFKGLSIYNIRKKNEIKISDAPGAGKETQIKNQEIVFQTSEILQGRKTTFYKSYDQKNKQLSTIEKPKAKDLEVKVNAQMIELYKNGEMIRSFSPLGDYYYIWTSFSPDKTKILFTAAGKGTYICDLQGTVQEELGTLNAPKWMNNTWVLGMKDKDNGEVLTSSDIEVIHIPSKKIFNLTEKLNDIAIYPDASPAADRIIFQNTKGEIFYMNVRLKD
jgi:hypothetical protein